MWARIHLRFSAAGKPLCGGPPNVGMCSWNLINSYIYITIIHTVSSLHSEMKCHFSVHTLIEQSQVIGMLPLPHPAAWTAGDVVLSFARTSLFVWAVEEFTQMTRRQVKHQQLFKNITSFVRNKHLPGCQEHPRCLKVLRYSSIHIVYQPLFSHCLEGNFGSCRWFSTCFISLSMTWTIFFDHHMVFIRFSYSYRFAF